ncbi:hypothetical protein HXX76_005404 [Chlamydomonas incerta]|uniref:Fe2OG dioxygenase domain-containing protein n=1 Tax=Chlamydomonas incerta TaxID=51695 RepID=A0A835T2T3_CHLIN|nr:hypothetical protein HXX76_005404 [Chlamydomonas incerta]|eukprot:KAG2437784.1 hypothetical protein HXX76_005404 [Chlamydomonas incerta]
MAGLWKAQLKAALDGAKSEANRFAVAGVDAGPLPTVSVRGVGKLVLPIDAEQAEDLVFAGTPAPYGKGANTELDPQVRKAIQLEPGRVRFSADWDATLRRIKAGVAAALGIPGGGAGVEARLYKLLVYERGGHFTTHRDTEKEPGMFGTLLVQLPVAGGHTGGKLSISHTGQRVEWDTAGSDAPASGVRYAAFYADCEHELAAVQSGRRVVLAYNLVRTQPTAHMSGPLACFSSSMTAAADAVTAAVTGSTESGAYYGKRSRRRWNSFESEDEIEDHAALALTAVMDDEIDTETKGIWVSPLLGRLGDPYNGSGINLPLENSLLDGQELFPNGLQPDEREYEGYTGNAGPSLTYTYHRALVVAWPRSRRALLPYTPDNATAALELAQQRLKHLQAGGAGPGLSRAECEAKLAVEGAVGWALRAGAGSQQPRSRPGVSGVVGALTQALQLVTAPQVAMLCGEEWRAETGVRLLQALAGAAKPGDPLLQLLVGAAKPGLNLQDAGLQATIASAASSMASSDAFGDATESLVAQEAVCQLTCCYALATHAHMPAPIRNRLLATLVAAVFGAEGMAAGVMAGSGCAVGAPATVATASGFARLKAADVTFLASLVFAAADERARASGGAGDAAGTDVAGASGSTASGSTASGVFSGLVDAFTTALLRRRDRQTLLPGLLKEPALQQALRRQDPRAVRLADARMQHLGPRVAAGVPLPDCSPPHASYPHEPAGRTATVRVVKGPRVYEQRVAAYHQEVNEMAELRHLLVGAHGAGPGAGAGTGIAVPAGAGAAGGVASGQVPSALQPAPQLLQAGPVPSQHPQPPALLQLQAGRVVPQLPRPTAQQQLLSARPWMPLQLQQQQHYQPMLILQNVAPASGQLGGGVTRPPGGSAQGLVPPQQQGPLLLAEKPGPGQLLATAAGLGACMQPQQQLLQPQRQQARGGGGSEVVDLTDD